MVDHLKEKCNQLKIKLLYNTNKRDLLSAAVIDEQPIVRANKIFRNAPEKTAQAVVDYYAKRAEASENLHRIYSFITEHIGDADYRVAPRGEAFLKLFDRNKGPVVSNGKSQISEAAKKSGGQEASEEAENMTEAEIKYILRTDFWGNKSSLKSEDFINESNEDFIELDIVIEGL